MKVYDIIYYVQCYYQAFGLGVVSVLLIQHLMRKLNEKDGTRC
jgi:sulfur relay (sulfurtransferase) DsrC/TusE family protein